jgi:plastocyanin
MKTRSLVPAVLISLSAATLVAGCGSSSKKSDGGGGATTGGASSSASTSSTGSAITIKNFAYNDLTVAAGTKVTVTNSDSTAHTVTSDDKTSFDTGSLAGSKSATITAPSKAGKYTFYCKFHNYMHGTLTVSG